MSKIPAKEKILIRKRIRWAKRKADWIDPLISEDDPILRKKDIKEYSLTIYNFNFMFQMRFHMQVVSV